MHNEIMISKDALFKLIQEIKEIRKMIVSFDGNDLLKKHDLLIQGVLLDKILKNGGIDSLLEQVPHLKRKYLMKAEVINKSTEEDRHGFKPSDIL